MTAQVIALRPRGGTVPPSIKPPAPRIIPTDPWWHCPAFCDGDCYGGDAFDYGTGRVQVTSRHHQGTVYRADSGDNTGREVSATIQVSVVEDPDDGWTEQPSVYIDVNADLDPDTAIDVANAVVRAALLARQPLPTVTRSLSHGGGRAFTPEAS